MTADSDPNSAPAGSSEPARRRRRFIWLTAVIALCAVAAVAVWVGTRDPALVAASRTQAPPAIATPSPSPTPTLTSPAPSVAPGVPVRLRVDAVGVDAEVLPTASVGGAFDPPTLGEAYWIEAFGAPGTTSDNTVYLLGHSWDDGDAVFNALFDRASQTSRVAPGDEVVVTTGGGDVTYVVERTERLAKEQVAQETNDVWKKVPGRLLLITCFQNNEGGRTLDNFVVFATVAA